VVWAWQQLLKSKSSLRTLTVYICNPTSDTCIKGEGL
jgi:hypothetical protein